jgi:hypothetical protein
LTFVCVSIFFDFLVRHFLFERFSIFFDQSCDAEVDLQSDDREADGDDGLVGQRGPDPAGEEVRQRVQHQGLVRGQEEETQQDGDQLEVRAQGRADALLNKKH